MLYGATTYYNLQTAHISACYQILTAYYPDVWEYSFPERPCKAFQTLPPLHHCQPMIDAPRAYEAGLVVLRTD